jgi:hypothetical protein
VSAGVGVSTTGVSLGVESAAVASDVRVSGGEPSDGDIDWPHAVSERASVIDASVAWRMRRGYVRKCATGASAARLTVPPRASACEAGEPGHVSDQRLDPQRIARALIASSATPAPDRELLEPHTRAIVPRVT